MIVPTFIHQMAQKRMVCTIYQLHSVDSLSIVVKQKNAIVPAFTHRIPHNVWCVRSTEFPKRRSKTENDDSGFYPPNTAQRMVCNPLTMEVGITSMLLLN